MSQRNILLGRLLATLLPQTVAGKAATTAHSQNREPRGTVTFPALAIGAVLTRFGLPASSPLSLLCVEILPGPQRFKRQLLDTETGAAAAVLEQEDPLGAQLGQRRILRTSPLTAVPAIC